MDLALAQRSAKMQGPLQCKPANAQVGTVLVQFENEPELSMKNEEYDMVLEVIGHGVGRQRRVVDIVMVLDVSQNMGDDEMDAMKDAVVEAMNSLCDTDRVSIITFAKDAQRKTHFRFMTGDNQEDVETLVCSLTANNGPANIGAGLQQALNLIDNRKQTNRYAAIILISNAVRFDGDQINLDRFPIFTFDLGTDKCGNSSVLKDIARKSNGKYCRMDLENEDFDVLTKWLEEFKGKPIKDVKLILKPLKGTVSRNEESQTKINQVYAGKYPVSPPDATTGSRTVSLGSLDEKERRKVLVTLSLPSVKKQVHLDSLRTYCLFRDEKGNQLQTNPLIFRVKRYAAPKVSQNHIKEVDIAKNELVYSKIQTVTDGPYGSQMKETNRLILGEGERIKEVILRHGFIVDAICFTVELKSGATKTIEFGGGLGYKDKIKLNSGERITQIKGVYGNYIQHKNQCVIGKLWIHTNLEIYGPYGQGREIINQRSFTAPSKPNGSIIGFFARYGIYLESIGVFMKKKI